MTWARCKYYTTKYYTTPSGLRHRGGCSTLAGLVHLFWGHLVHIDHGPNGPKVKGTGVTACKVVSATTRHIEGTAEVNV